MRGAPSVSVPVGRSRFGRRLVASLSALGLLLLTAWTLASPALPRQGGVALLLLVVSAWAWHSQRPRWHGVLHGQGDEWFLLAGHEPRAVDVAVTLDLQTLLLLRMADRESGVIHWHWLTPCGDAAHWQAVRRAVHAPRRAADRDAEPCDHPSP